jgi:hypothetical protein
LEQVQQDFAGAEPAKPEKATSEKSPAKARATVALDESDSSGSGHDYFQFMA